MEQPSTRKELVPVLWEPESWKELACSVKGLGAWAGTHPEEAPRGSLSKELAKGAREGGSKA